jgi:hypothetical protein
MEESEISGNTKALEVPIKVSCQYCFYSEGIIFPNFFDRNTERCSIKQKSGNTLVLPL